MDAQEWSSNCVRTEERVRTVVSGKGTTEENTGQV